MESEVNKGSLIDHHDRSMPIPRRRTYSQSSSSVSTISEAIERTVPLVDQVDTSSQSGNQSEKSYRKRKPQVKYKRRYCKVEGCDRIVKSQGLCQTHGAKTRRCKVQFCWRQAQGSFDGMCKNHYKQHTNPSNTNKTTAITLAGVVANFPLSRARNPPIGMMSSLEQCETASVTLQRTNLLFPVKTPASPVPTSTTTKKRATKTGNMGIDLANHLLYGFLDGNNPGWHRNEYRIAKRSVPICAGSRYSSCLSVVFEPWETDLAFREVQILVSASLPAGTLSIVLEHHAYSWGRVKGFHLLQSLPLPDPRRK